VLAFALVLATVPGTAIGLLAYRLAARAIEGRAGEQLAVLAKDVADEIGVEMAKERRNIEAWSRQEVMRDLIVGDIDKRLSKFLSSVESTYPGYVELFVANTDGEVVAASDPGRLGTHVVAPVGEPGELHPIRMPPHGRLVLEWAVPVFDPDAPQVRIGSLVAHYDWARVSTVAERVRRGFAISGLDLDLLIVDESGRVLGGAWGARVNPLGRMLADLGWTGVQGLRAAPQGRFALEPAADAIVGGVPATGLADGWWVLALQSRAEALGPVARMRRQVVLLMLAVVGLALGFGAWFAERLGRPLRELTAATRELAATGGFARPIPVRSSDEVGELATAFNVATADLQRARDDLVTASKLAFVGELAAGMAHEIRTPLGILRSSAQLLGRESASTAEHRGELAEMIVEEVDRLDRVVTGLTDLARPRALLVQPTALAEILGRVADFVERRAESQRVEIYREFAANADLARCDPDEIYQVALNVVMNAVQMMPNGGRLTLRTHAAHGGMVAFEVEDTGPGMSAERQAQVFTPFVSFREGGTGLGLALAQRTVVSHGGSIAVRSTEGVGTTFRVELPVAEERPA